MLIATQLMFAIITPALITGAFAERIKFTAFLLFTVLQWCRRSLGGLATGLFATVSVNPAGADGLFHGNPKQFFIQAVCAGAAIIYSLILSVVILKIVDAVIGLRVSREEEQQGLDITHQHS